MVVSMVCGSVTSSASNLSLIFVPLILIWGAKIHRSQRHCEQRQCWYDFLLKVVFADAYSYFRYFRY
jgi:hypothetical protein